MCFNNRSKRKFLEDEIKIKMRWQYDVALGIVLKAHQWLLIHIIFANLL